MEQPSKLTTEEFAQLFDSAVSFPGAKPPDGSEYLGCGVRKGETYYFWEGIVNPENGKQVLYATKRGLEFAKEMQEKSSHKREQKQYKTYNYNTT